MCLSSIQERDLNLEGEGWKVFEWDSDFFGFVEKGKWLKARKEKIGGYGPEYMSGFHIFTSYYYARKFRILGNADEWPIRKVKYRKGRILGRQEGCKVVVADEMYVP